MSQPLNFDKRLVFSLVCQFVCVDILFSFFLEVGVLGSLGMITRVQKSDFSYDTWNSNSISKSVLLNLAVLSFTRLSKQV